MIQPEKFWVVVDPDGYIVWVSNDLGFFYDEDEARRWANPELGEGVVAVTVVEREPEDGQ